MWTFGHKTQDLRQHKTYCVWLYVDVHVSPFERRVVLQDTLHWVFPFWDTWYYHPPLRVFQALSPWHPMLHLSEVWWLYQQISNENGIKYRPSVWSHFYWQRQRERVREKLGALSATVKIKKWWGVTQLCSSRNVTRDLTTSIISETAVCKSTNCPLRG